MMVTVTSKTTKPKTKPKQNKPTRVSPPPPPVDHPHGPLSTLFSGSLLSSCALRTTTKHQQTTVSISPYPLAGRQSYIMPPRWCPPPGAWRLGKPQTKQTFTHHSNSIHSHGAAAFGNTRAANPRKQDRLESRTVSGCHQVFMFLCQAANAGSTVRSFRASFTETSPANHAPPRRPRLAHSSRLPKS